MKKILPAVVLFSIVVIHQSYAQVLTHHFPEKDGKERIIQIQKNSKADNTRILPQFDLRPMLEEDRKNMGEPRPFRFGKAFDINIELKSTDWIIENNHKIWSMEFFSKGAKSINFVLENLRLTEGAELYAYNTEGTVVYGPVTQQNNTDKGVFLTDLIQGERVTLYLREPSGAKEKSFFKIKRVVHGYRGAEEMVNGSPGASESCNNNINCFPAWDLQSDAVALVLLSDGTEWCSGSLLMSADQSFRPYFLSAFHCIDSNSNGVLTAAERTNAEDWMFKFQFKYTTCSGTTVSPSYTYNDATFRAAWNNTDFALMEMDNSPIGNSQISWAGWDRRANAPTSGAGIHHPAGDVMKISIENNGFQTSGWNGANNHWLLNYDDGVVQHVSSGSPVFDQNRRVVGQLHGNQNYSSGQSYCSQPRAEYGRFNVSWNGGGGNATRLSNWLDPCGTGANTTNTTRSPYFGGAYSICSGGSSVSLNGIPVGSAIVWTNSGNITRNSAQGSNPCTFSANGTGTGWVQAVVTPPNVCGNTFTLRKNIWAGRPTNTGINFGVWFSSPPNNQVPIYSSEAIGLFSNPNETAQG